MYDIAIIGGGIAGLAAAYSLAPHRSVIVLEREDQLGQHATGRSAAIFIAGYGTGIWRDLSRQSRPFLENPPAVFGPGSLLSPRGIMVVASSDRLGALTIYAQDLQAVSPGAYVVGREEALAKNPLLGGAALAGAVIDESAADIDVDRMMQGFARSVRQAGGVTATAHRVTAMTFERNRWIVETGSGGIEARCVINAAGAWADEIAQLAKGSPKNLQVFRRSAAIAPVPHDLDVRSCPMVFHIDEHFYFKPEAGKLLISPAEETSVSPHDAFPDELDLAMGIDRAQAYLSFDVSRIDHQWAGLRTFSTDRTPMIGADPVLPNFYWSAGQGGFGVQTSPAWGAQIASLLLGKPANLPMPSYG